MAISINGMIAKTDDNTDWISIEEWQTYSSTVQKTGCVIIGRRTYQILTKEQLDELKNVKIVVISKEPLKLLTANHHLAKSPKEAIELLKNFEKIIVAGGGETNASFLRENLLDEIYLDLEPEIIGAGIPLFRNINFETKLKLIEQKQITANEIQLHYNVLK